MDESFITRQLMSAALALRDLPPRRRPLALFVSELEDDEFSGELHKLEAREEAAAVETIPTLRIVK